MNRASLMMASAIALIFAGSAQASLILTPDGIANGFTLSTFATINPGNTGCCQGPFGMAMTSDGNVMVGSGQSIIAPTRWVFPDIDGQTVTPSTALFTVLSEPTTVGGFANAGGVVYASEVGIGVGNHRFLALNNDGTLNRVLTGVDALSSRGMWANPVNGHIIAQSSMGLIDIDPLANSGLGSYRIINGTQGDGLTVSADGKTVYSVQNNNNIIKGYDIDTGALVYTSPVFPGIGPEGVGIISSGNAFNGQMIVSANNGNIYLLDPVTNTFVVIATGGTRGDYVAPDLSNGTLFIAFSDIVARLGCGANCTIGFGGALDGASVPEPANALLMITGVLLLCLGFHATRRRKI